MTNEIHDIIAYRGNKNIKGKGAILEFTQEMVDEYIKCAKDPIYFAEKYIKIVHVDHGLIPIELYDYQKDIITATKNSRRVAVNTSRQAGKTTSAVVILLHYILFNQYKTVGILANKESGAKEVLQRIKIAYEALPHWLQQGVVEFNKQSIELENGCVVIAGTTTSSSMRGKSFSFLYIDETAHIEGWEEFFSSVYPTISSGKTTKILMTSTPYGLNHFYHICAQAQENKNGYIYIEVPWNKVPGRDEEWKQETLAGMNFNKEKFEQEFECAFMGSSGTLISGHVLKSLALAFQEELYKNDVLHVYENPKKGRIYVCIVDVSRGKGLDYSAFSIFDATEMPYKQVCVYRDNMITPVEYSGVIHSVAQKYNNAMILVEINDIGGQVSDMLHFDYEAENIIFTESAGRAGKRATIGWGTSLDKGIRTTKAVKSVGCSVVKMLIEQNQLILADKKTIDEFTKFSKRGASYEAESGSTDDLVMGCVLFAWLTTQTLFKEMTDINTMMALREKSEDELMDEILPFGLTYDDVEEVAYEPRQQVRDLFV